MRRIILQGLVVIVALALMTVASPNATAQESSSEKSSKQGVQPAAVRAPVNVYRVDYAIREMEDAKILNSRKYTLMESGDWARSRVGNQVPYSTGVQMYQYKDVGMNIDCRVRDQGETILLESRIEFSSMGGHEPSNGVITTPIFRRVSSEGTAAVSLGKPMIIGSMDDVTSNHRFEIEATVTKVK